MAIIPGWHKKGTLKRLYGNEQFFSEEIDPAVLPENIDQVKCPSCQEMPARSFSFCGSKIERTKQEIEEKVKAEAKEIVKKIKNGDQNAISEIKEVKFDIPLQFINFRD